MAAELYRTENHPKGSSELPQYVVLCGCLYKQVAKEDKKIKLPYYIIRQAKLFRTKKHPDGCSTLPQYEIKGYKIYRTASHEYGPSELPDYIIR